MLALQLVVWTDTSVPAHVMDSSPRSLTQALGQARRPTVRFRQVRTCRTVTCLCRVVSFSAIKDHSLVVLDANRRPDATIGAIILLLVVRLLRGPGMSWRARR